MNNKFNKFKQFIKKEGFYVILFVCLCAVATVAAITAGGNKDTAINPTTTQEQKGTVVEPKDPQGALQVKEDIKPVPNVQVQNKSQAVSNTGNKNFVSPVKGSLGRAYSEDPVKFKTTNDHKTHPAMDIKAEKGASVVAVSDGVVKNVDRTTEGVFVEIDHQNGLVTRYANLDEKLAVKKGDKVKASQEIGKVGNTTNLAYEEYGTYLHFEVLKDGKNVDPASYVNYKK
ncbi:M23 family metallopeptidase [Clostridium sp. UBA4548]|uniref:M23 family metallopeptidase n=1 Tax=Clostridium sp. UBA4548 TaxID=1946361 RepID=UPI0025C37FBF|nr:M23 family metallopeptidase [Clostridium sp. UBA4548]